MSDKSGGGGSKRRTVSDWKRPPGPLNVWRIVDGEERLAHDTNRRVKLSIQDVPEDRYEEAIDHMCQYFVADEATCKSLGLKDDQDAMNDFRLLWDYLLRIGMSVGAFKLDSNDKLLELVAINILFIHTDKIEEALENFTINFKSQNARELFGFMHDVSEEADVRDIYGVDTYISALGLSVAPAFRGQQLGVRLLEVRNDIGRKYGIPATSTIFTAPASQIQAQRAGFETVFTKNYEEVLDSHGNLLFPNIGVETLKIMIKRL